MPQVSSSAIRSVDYDAASRRMWITFTSGPTAYSYCGVPESVYRGLMNAGSKGRYFDDYIRDRYAC